ncbi:hypothetical protein IAR50_002142 [Cryptococcus sp. DSM 104548]
MRPCNQNSTFIILGPDPNQCLEITSESSDGSSTYSPSHSLPSTPSRNPASSLTVSSPYHSLTPCALTNRQSATPLPTTHNSWTPSPTRSKSDFKVDWLSSDVPAIRLDHQRTRHRGIRSTIDQMPQDAEEEDTSASEGGSPVILTPVSHGMRQRTRIINMSEISMLLNQPFFNRERATTPPSGYLSRTSSSATVIPTPLTPNKDQDKQRPRLGCAPLIRSQDDVEGGCGCASCARRVEASEAKMIMPCRDIVCAACFSSTVAALSVTQGRAKCPACLDLMDTFGVLSGKDQAHGSSPSADSPASRGVGASTPSKSITRNGSVVMRIDNVGWDMTPSVVEEFLPPNSLSNSVLQSVHIILDRFDGRTKDYIYIEVASLKAARHILATRQNAFMPSGKLKGHRLRAVTISAVPQQELVDELRPRSNLELHALLSLCQSAVAPSEAGCKPSGAGKYIKARHGPFYMLMSTLSRLGGKESPSYSDLHYVTSEAIAALTDAISRKSYYGPTDDFSVRHQSTQIHEDDEDVRQRLLLMFDQCFGRKQPLTL